MNDVNEIRRKLLALRRRVEFPELAMTVWLRPPTTTDFRAIRDPVKSEDLTEQGFQLAVSYLIQCGEDEDGTALFGPEHYDQVLKRLPLVCVEKLINVFREHLPDGLPPSMN